MKFTADEQIRIDILVKYTQGNLHLDDALPIFKVKERQFRRIVKRFREEGVLGALHGNKARSPQNKTSDKLKNQILSLFRLKYFDLNIAHFREKLVELEDLEYVPCYATIRKILLEEKLVQRVKKRPKKPYSRRKRYSKEGLMVQIDGSHHRWIYGQMPFCLTAAIDDATGKILGAKFTETETTFAAMDVVESIIVKYGLFQMLYSDKAGIYGGGKRIGYTNMDRSLRELGILSVQANSPQAKGRVERLFGTLQSRLVAEMRLNNIQTIEQANKFLQEIFIEQYNNKFAVQATCEQTAYRALNANVDLNEVFTMRETRVVQNGNIINYNSSSLLVESDVFLGKRQVEIRQYRDGSMKYWLENKELTVRIFEEAKSAA